ncbi:MAG: hypothetical protein COA79_04570 [Planctomycetota bacterium]|nr:MAG: hypothetical protein COA79_04570 [Planctomycetota bacterium]
MIKFYFVIHFFLIFTCTLLSQEYVAPKSLPLMNKRVIQVSSVKDLESKLLNIADNTTIVIAPGIYKVSVHIYIRGRKNIEIRGKKFNRNLVKIIGQGYKNKNFGDTPHCLEFSGCTNVRVSNLSIGDVYHHPIAMQGNCTDMHFYNIRFFDAGEQFLKGNSDTNSGRGVLRGKVEYCLFEYTKMARSWYTQGVDIHTGKDWIVRNNIFNNIMGPSNDQLAGHAILFWNGSSNSICENNLMINCARGIAFGLSSKKPKAKGKSYDHEGGMIKNNIFIKDPGVRGDDGIIVNNSPGSKIINNIVICSGYPTPIEYRYKDARNIVISGNKLDGKIIARDGATGVESKNKSFPPKSPIYIAYRKKALRSLKDAQNFVSKSSSFKYLKSIAKNIYAKRSLGLNLKTIRKKLLSDNAAEKSEAEELFIFIKQTYDSKMNEALELQVTDPIGALKIYEAVAKTFRGDEFAIKATEISNELKAKPSYKEDKFAAGMFKRIKLMLKRLRPYKGPHNYKDSKFKKTNASLLKSIARSINSLVKRYPNSSYSKSAKELKTKLLL